MTFDSEQSKSGRDAGMAQALAASPVFSIEAGKFIIALPHGWTGTGEDIRRAWFDGGGMKPHHHNAWGGLIHGAIVQGYLIKLNKRKPMEEIASHARSTDIYQRV